MSKAPEPDALLDYTFHVSFSYNLINFDLYYANSFDKVKISNTDAAMETAVRCRVYSWDSVVEESASPSHTEAAASA